ncbi:MAG: NAD(P)H-quinone oxidoreductase [Gammaproteobacteria bacterium]|jgi:putative PIG3 family NAD(P)H quinone oxidoreductase
MKAILVEDGKLVWGEATDPTPGPGEILIRNRATAINRADLAQRAGNYPPPPGASEILGLECAGEVVAVGEDVTSYAVGDPVCALLAGGGYAERVAVAAGQALPVPKGIALQDAAALPEVFATAYLNIFMEARAEVGERVLLHAGASGVGTAAIQLCREFDNPCFVTAGSEEKIARCKALGAVGGVNRHAASFVDFVADWTEGSGFDVILDPVGGSYLGDNLRSLNRDGRLVIIGLMGGANAEIPLGLMMVKRLRVIGSTLRARSTAAKSRVMDELRDRVWPLIEEGEIEPIIEARMPIHEADAAHALIASNETFGKVILTID